MNGVAHDVLGVHGLLEVAGDALQRDGAALGQRRVLRVHAVRECEAKGDGRAEHLDADEEVLPAGGHGTCADPHEARLGEDRADGTCFLKDGQHHT